MGLDLVGVLDLVVVFEDIGELGQQFELFLGENAGEMFRGKSHEFRLRRAAEPTLEIASTTAKSEIEKPEIQNTENNKTMT